jgi:hypothetical protein
VTLPGEDNGCQREWRATAVCYLIESYGIVEKIILSFQDTEDVPAKASWLIFEHSLTGAPLRR